MQVQFLVLSILKIKLDKTFQYYNWTLRPIGQNQGVQFPISEAFIEIEAANLMRYKACELLEKNGYIRQLEDLSQFESWYTKSNLFKLKDSTKPSHSPRHRNLNGHTRVNPYIPREGKNIGDYWNEDIVRTAVMNNVFYDTTKEHPAPFHHENIQP